MATRKRAKSVNDINEQLNRITTLRYKTDDSNRFRKAKEIAKAYMNNISSTKTYKADFEEARNGRREEVYPKLTRGAWARKYVNYNTDRAKAASNG